MEAEGETIAERETKGGKYRSDGGKKVKQGKIRDEVRWKSTRT